MTNLLLNACARPLFDEHIQGLQQCEGSGGHARHAARFGGDTLRTPGEHRSAAWRAGETAGGWTTETAQKADVVNQLGAERDHALGNGANDADMLGEAALGIAVVGPEGPEFRFCGQ